MLIRIFQVIKITAMDDFEGRNSVPVMKLAALLMPSMDHPIIAFSTASFFLFTKTWINDNNNPTVTINPRVRKKGDRLSKPVKKR